MLQVAVRVRPLVNSETERGCKHILDIFPDLNILHVKPSDKQFSYNFIFDDLTSNENLYNKCVKNMIPNLFAGYNATIFAYGQTGSGKTHTMGTSYNENEEKGVIPRAVDDIFNYTKHHLTYNYNISVSFMELYEEVLYDLLSSKTRDQSVLEIGEDTRGIYIPGLKEIPVQSSSDVIAWLKIGSSARAVASTNMNTQSSRSHTIFSINIFMQNKNNKEDTKSSKFYLVDLAGMQRTKKTGACGITLKEGVNINKGLRVLGKVISILGEHRSGNQFVPYHNSNLTRLLKDSLGGNSLTLMITCVSPADYNIEETISALRYAGRANKIKNKPIVNKADPDRVEINELKKTIENLQQQLIRQVDDYDKIFKENQELHRKQAVRGGYREMGDNCPPDLNQLAMKNNNWIIIDYDLMAQKEAQIIALKEENAKLLDQVSIQPTPKISILLNDAAQLKKEDVLEENTATPPKRLKFSPKKEDDSKTLDDNSEIGIRKDKKYSRIMANLNSAGNGETNTMKHSVRRSCMCSTNCNSRCGCKRLNVLCNDMCRCTSDLCKNRI